MRETAHIALCLLLLGIPTLKGQDLTAYIQRARNYYMCQEKMAMDVDLILYSDPDFKVRLEKRDGRYIHSEGRYRMEMADNLTIQTKSTNVSVNAAERMMIVSKADSLGAGIFKMFSLEQLKSYFEKVTYLGRNGDSEGFQIDIRKLPGIEISSVRIDFDVKLGYVKRFRLRYRPMEQAAYGKESPKTFTPSVDIVYRPVDYPDDSGLYETAGIIRWEDRKPVPKGKYSDYTLFNNLKQ